MTTSALRTVAVTGASSPYGIYALSYRFPVSEAGSVIDYSFDVSSLLSDVATNILSATISVSPHNELTISNPSVSGGVVTFWASGGIPGRSYIVRVDAVSGDAHTFEAIAILPIDLPFGSMQPGAPASPGFGSGVTCFASQSLGLNLSRPLSVSTVSVVI